MVAALLGLVAGACGGGVEEVRWRNVAMTLPAGWVVVDESVDHVTLANRPPGPEGDTAAAGPVVVLGLSYEPDVVPDDWRRLVEELGGTVESDAAIIVGEDVPATRIVYSSTVDGVRSRTMVVIIPSRWIVALAEPVVGSGPGDPGEALLAELDAVLAVLVDARYGPPDLS